MPVSRQWEKADDEAPRSHHATPRASQPTMEVEAEDEDEDEDEAGPYLNHLLPANAIKIGSAYRSGT